MLVSVTMRVRIKSVKKISSRRIIRRRHKLRSRQFMELEKKRVLRWQNFPVVLIAHVILFIVRHSEQLGV
jgi:hypothetical protein